MARTWWYSLTGFGGGFFLGYVLVQIATGGAQHSDTVAVTVFLGSFLAAAGAVAGALIGGVADLLAFRKKENETLRNAHTREVSEDPRE